MNIYLGVYSTNTSPNLSSSSTYYMLKQNLSLEITSCLYNSINPITGCVRIIIRTNVNGQPNTPSL